MIWVARNSAMRRPLETEVISASHSWVVRPPWISDATISTSPSRAVPTKLHFTSAVVKFFAPSGHAVDTP